MDKTNQDNRFSIVGPLAAFEGSAQGFHFSCNGSAGFFDIVSVVGLPLGNHVRIAGRFGKGRGKREEARDGHAAGHFLGDVIAVNQPVGGFADFGHSERVQLAGGFEDRASGVVGHFVVRTKRALKRQVWGSFHPGQQVFVGNGKGVQVDFARFETRHSGFAGRLFDDDNLVKPAANAGSGRNNGWFRFGFHFDDFLDLDDSCNLDGFLDFNGLRGSAGSQNHAGNQNQSENGH